MLSSWFGRLIHMHSPESAALRRLAGIIVFLAVTACGKPHRIGIEADDVVSSYTAIPAGDSVKLRATLWSESGAFTHETALYPGLGGFTWGMTRPIRSHIATISSGPVVRGIAPGRVTVLALARGVSGSADLEVVWPLDSVELRFAARSVRVGDTVELLHRVHFVSGEISTERYRGYSADGLDAKTPRKGDRTLSGWSALGLHANATQWDPGTRELGDTILYVAQRPGVFRVGGMFYNRWAEDTLRIQPRLGVPRSYRQRIDGAAKPRASAVACFTLDFGKWDMEGEDWPRNWPPPEKFFAWIPKAIALDTTPLIRAAPGEGYRLDPARGPVAKMGRSWIVLPHRDSLELRMTSPKEYSRVNTRASVIVRIKVSGDTAISGTAEADDQMHSLVSGRRIPCG